MANLKFKNEILGLNAQVVLAASRVLDNLASGTVGKVELNLGTHNMILQTKKRIAKKGTVAKKVSKKKVTKRATKRRVRK